MPFPRVKPSAVSLTRDALVWLLAGIVFALGLLNASPSAHDRLLHTDDHDHAIVHDDAGCAVTLLAQGATAPLELPRVLAPLPILVSQLVSEPDNLLLASEPHLNPPGRGPPSIG